MSSLLSLALMLSVMPIQAAGQASSEALRAVDPPEIHVTDVINGHPAARAARETFAMHGPALAKAGTVYRIGQTQTFKVYNVTASKHSENLHLDVLPFTLMAEGERFRIWVETAEIDKGHVRAQEVADLYDALNSRTPEGSIAPESGIMANDEALFGAPPDVDGDGATDVLLVDIRDGYRPGDGFVAGFVWHGDLDPRATQGNGRDILYIDTYPGMYRDGAARGTQRAEATAAHEYQHLIHLGYDRNELTFVNEGLSEWAEAANGYAEHAPTYLTRPAAHNVGLLDWHDDEPDLRLDDYGRAGLFTTYMAQRLGAKSLQGLVHAGRGGKALIGADGYRALLTAAGLSLERVVADFHTANFVNDREIDPDFGYADAVHQSLPVVPTRLFDGRDGRSTNVDDLTLRPGGVTYLSWRYVADFQFQASGSSVLVRAVLAHTDGRVEVRSFSANGTLRTLSGDFKKVTLALIHTVPDGDPASVSVGAVWEEGGTSGIRVESAAYDDGRAEAFFTLSGGGEGGQATRFVVPEGDARLERIAIAPYFMNQFEGSFLSRDAERVLEVRIWEAAAGAGPGDALLSIPVTDPRPYTSTTRTLTFFDVDLTPYDLSNLPDTVYIGLVNAGSDGNHLVAAVSSFSPDHAPESVSYTGYATSGIWKPLWEVQLVGSADAYPMRERVIPIRAEFVVTGLPDDGRPGGIRELPDGIALDQNYPNPFNPRATIRYHLEQAGTVRLAVYDLMGRRVATLADGLQGAGTHQADVNAAAWASGSYVYVLEADGRRATRTMVLAK